MPLLFLVELKNSTMKCEGDMNTLVLLVSSLSRGVRQRPSEDMAGVNDSGVATGTKRGNPFIFNYNKLSSPGRLVLTDI